VNDALAKRRWACDVLLRGSLARGSADAESDIDTAVTVSPGHFDSAINELAAGLPDALPGGLPPWLDSLVRDFGGAGFVYLVPVEEAKWGQIDIYALPHERRQSMLQHEPVQVLHAGTCASEPSVDTSEIDSQRRRIYRRFAAAEDQAVLACYVMLFLLRKRVVRRDQIQMFAEIYAAAACVRDLVVHVCHANRPEHGWHGLAAVGERSPDPALVRAVLSTFTSSSPLERPAALGPRVRALEELVALLVPTSWSRHGSALRSLGRYLIGSGD
jgi:hypothetical protein